MTIYDKIIHDIGCVYLTSIEEVNGWYIVYTNDGGKYIIK